MSLSHNTAKEVPSPRQRKQLSAQRQAVLWSLFPTNPGVGHLSSLVPRRKARCVRSGAAHGWLVGNSISAAWQEHPQLAQTTKGPLSPWPKPASNNGQWNSTGMVVWFHLDARRAIGDDRVVCEGIAPRSTQAQSNFHDDSCVFNLSVTTSATLKDVADSTQHKGSSSACLYVGETLGTVWLIYTACATWKRLLPTRKSVTESFSFSDTNVANLTAIGEPKTVDCASGCEDVL